MSTFFNSVMSLPVPFNMVVLIVMIVVGASVISAVAKEIRRYFCHQSELEFKRELIDQGIGAFDEIGIGSVTGIVIGAVCEQSHDGIMRLVNVADETISRWHSH